MCGEHGQHAQVLQGLDSIAVIASTPIERLQYGWVTDTPGSQAQGQARLQRLYDLLGADNEETQQRLFNHLAFSREQILCALSSPVPLKITSRPSWVNTLEQILRDDHPIVPDLGENGSLLRDPCLQPEDPQPFEELLLPFIRYARNQLHALLPLEFPLLRNEVQRTLERGLLSQLLSLAGPPLYIEFTEFRINHPAFEEMGGEKGPSRKLYQEFLSRYEGEGLLSLFREYSVLARFLVLRTTQWIEICQEFFQRLAGDREEIGQHFWPMDQPPGEIVEIDLRCSDPHHQGRSVFLLTFSNGRKLLYKPHCLDIDVAFFQLLAWLNEQDLSPRLKGARILRRATYGWEEYIEHLPCQTRDDVHRYYHRSGQLLCLFYILQTSDMHYENIIAHADSPIPIDLETVMTPPLLPLWTDGPYPKPAWQLTDACEFSVTQSTFLPMSMFVQGTALDLSFLGCVSEIDVPYSVLTWKLINTDGMHQIPQTARIRPAKNVLSFEGSIMKASDYLETIITGFKEMYSFLSLHRDALVAPDGPLVSFRACPGRYVFRPTFIYERQLQRLTHPDFLRDNADRWIDMQIFQRPLLKHHTDPRLWVIIASEIAALERLDVPRFEINPHGTELFTDEGIRLENMFSRSALAQTCACLSQLSDEDKKRQIALIRDAFAPLGEATFR